MSREPAFWEDEVQGQLARMSAYLLDSIDHIDEGDYQAAEKVTSNIAKALIDTTAIIAGEFGRQCGIDEMTNG